MSYVQQKRLYGDGCLRIDDKILLSKELYTLMYVSAFKHSEIERYIEVVTGELVEEEEEPEEEEELIDEFAEKKEKEEKTETPDENT